MGFRRNRITGKPEPGTENEGANALSRRFEAGDDSPTVLINPPPGDAGDDSPTDEAATRILRPEDADATGQDPMAAPPVAVLVIIDGAGKGHVRTMTYGMNPVGRDPGQRVSLDFGDPRVSREGHALLTYDSEGQRFYAQHGGGTNLTWVNGDPLLTPRELQARDRIRVGDTTLLFLPICDDAFDWQAPSEA